MAKKEQTSTANIGIAIAALIISALSFCFSFYSYKKSKEERISVIAGPILENFTTKIYKIGKLDVIPFFWEITLSNNSDKAISIVEVNVQSKGVHPFVSYSHLFGGTFIDFDRPLEAPINLNSGESKKFMIKIGIMCDSNASEIINSLLETTIPVDSENGPWIRRYVLVKMLCEKGIDVYGNKAQGAFDGEKLLSYTADPKKQQDFTVTFTTSNNTSYSKDIMLYMVKQ